MRRRERVEVGDVLPFGRGHDPLAVAVDRAGDPLRALPLRDAIDELNGRIAGYDERLADLATKQGVFSRSVNDTTVEVATERNALVEVRDALMESSGVTEEAIEYEKLMADAYKGSAAEIADKNEAVREATELTRGAIDSELDWLDTLDKATKSLDENAKKGWDKNTAAGRENLRLLGEIADGALEYSGAIRDAGGSQWETNVVIDRGRDALVDAAKQLGMSKKEAEDYATALGLIPEESSTKATADVTDARRELREFGEERIEVPIKATLDMRTIEQQIRQWKPTAVINPRLGQQVK